MKSTGNMDDFGFKKITPDSGTKVKLENLSHDTKKGTHSDMRKKRFFKTKKFGVGTGILLFLLLFTAFLAFRAIAIVKSAKATQNQAKAAYTAIKQQNIILAREELVKTQKQMGDLKKEINSIGFLGFIPFFGGYITDGQHLVNAGSDGISAAIIASDSIIPYADVLGLKGEKSFAMGSAEDRIRLAVNTMGKVVPKIDEIEAKVLLAKEEMNQVNPNRYPNFGPFKKIRSQIAQAKTMVNEGSLAVEQGKPLIKVLPELLGESSEKKYLVLFQNDAEQRPTGGFLTFYVIFRVEQGVIKVNKASDIYDLDSSIPSHPAPPPIIEEYFPTVKSWFIRDSNLSPDYYVSMQEFKKMYDTSSQKEKVDGIIAIDTHLLVNILNILGDVEAGGITFNSKNDLRCNCPQVVYVLEDNSTRPVGYVRENRKGIVGELLFAIMEKALKSSPKQYWGRLFQQGIQDAHDKHALFYLYNDEAQKGVQSLNWAGRIKPFEGDYLHINDANFGGAKSNLYVRQQVRMDYDIANDGTIKKTITLTYRNPEEHSDCNLERGGLCLNAVLRDFQRIYVPKGSTLDSSKGSEVKVKTKDDLGKTTYQGFFRLNPKGKAIITYTYTLPFKLKNGSDLPLMIQKEPGTWPASYEIYVNGRKVDSFDLVSDKELNLKI